MFTRQMCRLLTSVAKAFGSGELKKLYPCGVIYLAPGPYTCLK